MTIEPDQLPPEPPPTLLTAAPPTPADTPPPHREVEAKFAATDTESVRTLMWDAQPLEGFRASAAETHIYTDRYFDTNAMDLLRRGYALRLRRKGERPDLVVALKGLPVRGTGPVHDRFEFQGPVAVDADSGRAESWPVPVRAMVEFLAGHDAAVGPVCEIRQRRVERTISDDVAVVALLSVDEVAIVDPHAAVPAPSVTRFTEVEAEQAPGASPATFHRLVDALCAFPVTAQRESKLERGLVAVADRPAGLPELDGITPEMSMAEAGRLIWRRQLMAMALNEAGARVGDDIEYVHDMRVATRRARSAAQIFGAFFAPSVVRPVNKGLRKTAAMLGEVRDLDVALDKLESTGFGEQLPDLALAWQDERATAVRRLLKWLDSRAFSRFLAHFAHVATTHGHGARDYASPLDARVPHQVRHVFPAAMLDRYATARAYETVLAIPDVPVAVLHLLRIDCKRMRYVLEPITHLLGESGDELVKTLKRLQDALGELNDAEVAKTRLLAMAVQGRGGPGLAEYIGHQDHELARWREEVPGRWEPFVGEAYRQALAESAARM